MTSELLEIQPSELKFTFELKKQSSCSIQLGNKSAHYVAFKVKTTSPKKYCVRPNIGIIKPNATCDFTVTMQAQRVAPTDLHCKDKFLIQSAVVPNGTTEEDITSAMFLKDGEKCVEEKKLRVVLISPPPSPVLVPRNGEAKQDPYTETSVQKDKVMSGAENIPPSLKNVEGFELAKVKDEFRAANDAELRPTSDDSEELHPKSKENLEELKPAKDAVFLNLSKDFKDMTSKLSVVESKLKEAELTIMKLTEEKSKNTQEREVLKHELLICDKDAIILYDFTNS
ncbi:Vesicle-associated protein 2-2 [Morus notabilis]|uniref:Vesicle-associated protein 2-2 n=1 Tax=Morus notabilis TaxID=981085 RepID=W9RQC8_9ROSA|nr:Vesicle-associated protein 2-2 [Morus notabilis]